MRQRPDMTSNFDGFLYRAVSRNRAEEALANGIPVGTTFWAVLPIADYYAETVEDDGDDPAILKIRFDALSPDMMGPDMPGIEEPINTVLSSTDSLVYEAWCEGRGGWRDSLDLIGSVRYDGAIPASAITEA
jgi:hypothetical protein